MSLDVKISGFYDEVSFSLDNQIALIKAMGESYMCPRTIDGRSIASFTSEEFIRNIKPRLDASGIKFSSIGSPIGKINIDDEAGFIKQKEQLKELIKIAQAMGTEYIRIFSFYYNHNDPDTIFDQVIAKMKELLEIAKGSGVTLMHENEKLIYGDTYQRVLKLYHALKDDGLVLCYDASNFIQVGCDPVASFDALKDYIVYYHIKDCAPSKFEVPLGLGAGHYDYIFKSLNERNYSGFMTLEPHTFKYVLNKPKLYYVPFLSYANKEQYQTYRMIDRAYHIGYFENVSRKTVFLWQYKALKKMIGEYNG